MFDTLKAGAAAFGFGFAASASSAETIVDIAAGDERFSTLVAAVSAAGLIDTLAEKRTMRPSSDSPSCRDRSRSWKNLCRRSIDACDQGLASFFSFAIPIDEIRRDIAR